VSHQLVVAGLSKALVEVVPEDLRVLTGANVFRRTDCWLADVDLSGVWPT
jgi:hypothetical protein